MSQEELVSSCNLDTQQKHPLATHAWMLRGGGHREFDGPELLVHEIASGRGGHPEGHRFGDLESLEQVLPGCPFSFFLTIAIDLSFLGAKRPFESFGDEDHKMIGPNRKNRRYTSVPRPSRRNTNDGDESG